MIRIARISDLSEIMDIILFAKQCRKEDGSTQWQNGYPDKETILMDIRDLQGYVFLVKERIVAYAAVIIGIEPSYDHLEGGHWLTQDSSYLVIHRMAVKKGMKGKGIAIAFFQEIEQWAENRRVKSIRVDTNFDNPVMLHIIDRLDYQYCGEVFYDGDPRKAFEKVLF